MTLFIALQVKLLKRRNKILLAILIFPAGIFAQLSDSLRIDYNYVNSVPQNAEVYVNNELVGNTPLFFTWKDSVFPKEMKIKMNGFAEFVKHLTDYQLLNKTYTLVPLTGTFKINLVKEDKPTYFNNPRKIVPIVISSLAAIGAGISAYYFKSLAVDNRDAYDATGDPAALERKKKYDILSGVSLVVFQLGFTAAIYYLFIN
jgi:hypothetical protein